VGNFLLNIVYIIISVFALVFGYGSYFWLKGILKKKGKEITIFEWLKIAIPAFLIAFTPSIITPIITVLIFINPNSLMQLTPQSFSENIKNGMIIELITVIISISISIFYVFKKIKQYT